MSQPRSAELRLRTFSIIIPTFNRPAALASCLDAIAQLDYPRDRMEVVVVDDGGTESVQGVIDAAQRELRVRLLRQRNSGPASARNRGALEAKGEFLAFTDDDCRPQPGWLRALDAAFAENGEALLGGRIENGLPENRFSSASQLLIDYLYRQFYEPGSGNEPGNEKGLRSPFFTSNNLAMKKECFLRLGGFNASYPLAAAEDRELCHHLQRQAGLLVYVPEARIRHFHRLSLRGFWAQNFRYGRGAARFHGGAGRSAESVGFERGSFYLGMFVHPFRHESCARAAGSAALLLVSQLAHTFGYCTELLASQPKRAEQPQ